MIPRQCDIVKKTSFVFTLFCVVLLFYHYVFNNELSKCQNNVNESDVMIIQKSFRNNKTSNEGISIYLPSNQKEIDLNELKPIARLYQQRVDKERYIDKVVNLDTL